DMRRILGELCGSKYGVVAEDAGALAPPAKDTREAFELMLLAAEKAGVRKDIHLGLDVAATGFFEPQKGTYRVGPGELSPDELLAYYETLAAAYPLIYIEDPFEEDDYAHFAELTKRLPGVEIVGDDIFATNAERLQKGIDLAAGNMLLMKVNQAGTITETLRTAKLATDSGFGITASLRSGETTDDFQADVAVAAGAFQMKLGSPVRGERNAKYNRLWTISRMEAERKEHK
ncbi:MAG: phosphopyruvate hydratase, partial [Firmicutes bacterium]|nr:phosphopyruvate hydratase [Bacillota bacterium]